MASRQNGDHEFRAAAAGWEFLPGVWEQIGRNKYFLSHIPWFSNNFPNDTKNGIGDPAGPTRITETVTLGPDCNNFSGTFTLEAYNLDGTLGQTFTGKVKATRITTSTTVPDLL